VNPTQLREVAEELAKSAGAVLRQKLTEARTVGFKAGDRSNLVTDADHAADRLIVQALRSRFPTHGLLTEESGTMSTGGLRWIVDPLDGTTNYAHGVPHFAVSIAVEGDWLGSTRVLAGAVHQPMLDELFSAARGEGATLNGRRLTVSSADELDSALLSTGFPYDLKLKPQAPLGLFDRLARRARGMRRMGSAALDLAYLAAGRFDGYFEFGLSPWDVAAGALLIEEAGGQIACIDGTPWDSGIGDVVAAGPRLFASLSAECSAFSKEIGFVARAR
jgi:myo-inositol-1(or 4)-monophosphatase